MQNVAWLNRHHVTFHYRQYWLLGSIKVKDWFSILLGQS